MLMGLTFTGRCSIFLRQIVLFPYLLLRNHQYLTEELMWLELQQLVQTIFFVIEHFFSLESLLDSDFEVR